MFHQHAQRRESHQLVPVAPLRIMTQRFVFFAEERKADRAICILQARKYRSAHGFFARFLSRRVVDTTIVYDEALAGMSRPRLLGADTTDRGRRYLSIKVFFRSPLSAIVFRCCRH